MDKTQWKLSQEKAAERLAQEHARRGQHDVEEDFGGDSRCNGTDCVLVAFHSTGRAAVNCDDGCLEQLERMGD